MSKASSTASLITEKLIEKLNEATRFSINQKKNNIILSFYNRDCLYRIPSEELKTQLTNTEQLSDFKIYTYEIDNTTQKLIIIPNSDTLKVDINSDIIKYATANIIDLSNINLMQLSGAELKAFIRLLGLADLVKDKLIIRNSRVKLAKVTLRVIEADFEGTSIYSNSLSEYFKFDLNLKKINLKNAKIIGDYACNINLFYDYIGLEYVNLENLQLLDNHGKKKQIFLGATFTGCILLKEIEGLPSFLSVNDIRDMYATFLKCKSLKKIDLGDNMNYSYISTINRLFEGCLSLEEVNLGDISTATNTAAGSLFGVVESKYPNMYNLKIKHKGRFPTSTDLETNQVYIEEQVVVLEHNTKSDISDLYTHNCIITDYLLERVYDILKVHMHIQRGSIKNCNVTKLQLNKDEIEKLLIKQQFLASPFTIFRGLIVLYDETLTNLIIVTEKP